MMNVAQTSWLDANQRYLWAALGAVRTALESYVQSMSGIAGDQPDEREEPGAAVGGQAGLTTAAMPAAATLETVCSAFGLTGFERDLLLLCAGVEMDTAFATLCAKAQVDPQRAAPTFSLALAALPDPHWSALSPAGPLRRWRLIEVGSGGSLVTSHCASTNACCTTWQACGTWTNISWVSSNLWRPGRQVAICSAPNGSWPNGSPPSGPGQKPAISCR